MGNGKKCLLKEGNFTFYIRISFDMDKVLSFYKAAAASKNKRRNRNKNNTML